MVNHLLLGIQDLRRKNWLDSQIEISNRKAMYEGDFKLLVLQYLYEKYGPKAYRRLSEMWEVQESKNLLYSVIDRTTLLYARPCRRAIITESKVKPAEKSPLQ